MIQLSSLVTGKLFEVLLSGFFICIAAVILCTLIAKKTNLVDMPLSEPHKQHKGIVYLSGGSAFFLTLVVAVILFRNSLDKQCIRIVIAAGIIFAFGLWDDYKALKPKTKIIGQCIAVMVLILFGIRTHLFDHRIFANFPFQIRIFLDILLTVFWFVFITNAFNLVDSTDGLMLGLSSWAFGFYIIAGLDANQIPVAMICAAALGACLSLTFFNSYPAFLFMGDSGAQTIGFILAAISIIYTPPEKLQSTTWFVPIMMLGVPIFDTTLVTISRMRKGQHFYHSGTDHTFHRLVKMGLSKIQATHLMHCACFTLEAASFLAISQTALVANLTFLVSVLIGLLLIFYFEREDLWIKINAKHEEES